MDQVVICNGVSIHTLNQHNFALKNDYIDNLISTAFMIFPVVTRVIGDRKIMIKRGFESHAYIMNEIDFAANHDLLKHSRGYAIEFTWNKWTDDEAMLVAIALYESVPENEYVKIVVDTENKTLYVGRDAKQTMIIEKSLNDNRVVRKAA